MHLIDVQEVVIKWCVIQPDFIAIMEQICQQKKNEFLKLTSTNTESLGAMFFGFRIENKKIISPEQDVVDTISYGFVFSSFIRNKALTNDLLNLMGVHHVWFNKTKLKILGEAIKRTNWWQLHGKEITLAAKHNSMVKKVMNS